MTDREANTVLLVTAEGELPIGKRVWGTGGWIMPEEREALDWLTLVRLLGWNVTVTSVSSLEKHKSLAGCRWIIIACDPDSLTNDAVDHLAARLAEEPILLVARAGRISSPLSRLAGIAAGPQTVSGRRLHWRGPGLHREWSCRKVLDALSLNAEGAVEQMATLDGAPLITGKRVGRGTVASLAFHPSEARDTDGAASALLRHLLICGSFGPVAWLDFEGTMILRMDDPGGAQNVYSREWSYRKLNEASWRAIGAEMERRRASLAIGYVGGWVDDGDSTRGTLTIDGREAIREPGKVYPSPLVKYHDLAGFFPGAVYDYQAEYAGIQALRTAGLADVELHGYTHMHPDTVAWSKAPDRHENWPITAWYRELGREAQATIAARPPEQHPLTLGLAVLQRYFDTVPTTLICPGDQWADDALCHALDLRLQLVSSYYLAIRDQGRFCWCQHICAPYLDAPDPVWFDAGLPVVGYFHDYELAIHGIAWLKTWLGQWQDAGATRFISFRDLAGLLSRRIAICGDAGGWCISMTADQAMQSLDHTIRVGVFHPDDNLPSKLTISIDNVALVCPVSKRAAGFGSVCIDPAVPNRDPDAMS